MKASLWHTSIAFVFSVLIMPALALGATPARPRAAEPTPFQQADTLRATHLLKRMQNEEFNVYNDAGYLQSYYMSGLTWQVDASELDRIAYQVQKMDNILYSLRNLKGEVDPAEAQAVARIAPQVTILTDEVNDSVHFLNRNQDYLWSPTWRVDTDELAHTSALLKQDLKGVQNVTLASLRAPAAKVAS
jgi:hypothetical protein